MTPRLVRRDPWGNSLQGLCTPGKSTTAGWFGDQGGIAQYRKSVEIEMSGSVVENRNTRASTEADTSRPECVGGSSYVALGAFAFAAFWTALFSLVTINRVKDVVVGIVLHGGSVSPVGLLHTLRPSDAAIGIMAAISMGLLVWIELRRRALSVFLRDATEIQAFSVLTIIAAWTGHAYLSPGILLGGDTATHVSRFLEVARGLDQGVLPTWTNYQYLGEPLLWFTGPLTYVVGGAIAAITGDAVIALKIFLFTSHIAAAWLFFAFMRRLDFRPVPAMIAAAGFSGCFAHLHLLLYRGVVPQALTIVGLVLLFYAAEGVMTRRGRMWANWLMVALATGGLIVNHQPHALFAAAYLALFGAVSLLLGRWQWSRLPALVLAALCGVAISAIAVLPVLVESDWVMIEPGDAYFLWHIPTLPRLGHLLLWRDTRTTWGFDYWAYLGITLVLLAIIGGWKSLSGGMGRTRLNLALATCVCLAVSLFLYNPVVRDILFLFFMLAILVGLGCERLEQNNRWAGRALLAATALVFIDIGSTSIQPVARNDKGFAIEAGRVLERHAPNERMIEMDLDANGEPSVDVGPDGGPVYYDAAIQRIAGNHNMAATHVHNYILAAEKFAETDLRRDHRLAPETRRMLELLNVTRILCQSPIASGCPATFDGTTAEDGLGKTLKLDGFPVLFSRKLVELPPEATLEKPMLWPWDFDMPSSAARIGQIDHFLRLFVDAERPQPDTRMGAAIAVRSRSGFSDQLPADLDWKPIVASYQVGLQSVDIRIESNAAGYAQISHPWFPATEVLIDGRSVVPIQGAIDLLVVPVHPGQNHIEIRAGTTPIRRISGWISLAGLLVAAVATIYLWLERRPRKGVGVPG
jgi:hypothetical protein